MSVKSPAIFDEYNFSVAIQPLPGPTTFIVAASLPALIRLMRPRQWVKNAFVAAPLFFTPEALHGAGITATAMAVFVFCLLSSAVYVVNDYCDREADRLHPEKRRRPIASGEVSAGMAVVLAVILLVAAAALSLTQPAGGFRADRAHLFRSQRPVFAQAEARGDPRRADRGHGLRAARRGGCGGDQRASQRWIMICTGLLALFLAVAKRRDDLVKTMSDAHRPSLAGYNLRFVDASLATGFSARCWCPISSTRPMPR